MSAKQRRSLSDAGNREREGASAWFRLVLIRAVIAKFLVPQFAARAIT
jgi:hypothetical protein